MISLKNTELCNTSGDWQACAECYSAIVIGDRYVVDRLVTEPPHHMWVAVLWLVVCYVLVVSLDNGGQYKIFKLSLKFSTFKSLEGGEKLFCSAFITLICLSMIFSNRKGYITAETEKGTSAYLCCILFSLC
jgi:hypothetical protein